MNDKKRPRNVLIRHLTDREIRTLHSAVSTSYWPRKCWPCANSLYLRILRSFLAMSQKERTELLRHAPSVRDWQAVPEGGLLINRKGTGQLTKHVIDRNVPRDDEQVPRLSLVGRRKGT